MEGKREKRTYTESMEWPEPFVREILEAVLNTAAISLSTSMNLSALMVTRSFRLLI